MRQAIGFLALCLGIAATVFIVVTAAVLFTHETFHPTKVIMVVTPTPTPRPTPAPTPTPTPEEAKKILKWERHFFGLERKIYEF